MLIFTISLSCKLLFRKSSIFSTRRQIGFPLLEQNTTNSDHNALMLSKLCNQQIRMQTFRANFTQEFILKSWIEDSLLIAMVLKGLPASFNSFKTVITLKEQQPTFQEIKVSLRSYEESEHVTSKSDMDMKLNFRQPSQISCYLCKKKGQQAVDFKQKRCSDNYNSNTHDTRCCRKESEKNSVSKVNLVNKGVATCTEEKVEFFFKIGGDPNMEIQLEDVNLLVDCGATTHIINDESKLLSFDQSFDP